MRFFLVFFVSLAACNALKAAVYLADTLTIAAVGDIMMGSAYPNSKFLPKDDAKGSFKAVLNKLRSADVSIGNLEGVLLDKGNTGKCKKGGACYAFRMPERYAAHLKNAGFDLLSVANNHSGDFGEKGRMQTARVLSREGIAFAGFKSHPYTLYVKDGIKYGFCAFSPNEGTVSLLDFDYAKHLIADLKKIADIIIVFFHGGAEGARYQHVTRKQEFFYGQDRGNVYEFAHRAIDYGADLVIGSGPHVTRAVDLYKKRFIAYSLGNFCTYGTFHLGGPSGLAPLLEIQINTRGEFIAARVTSIKQSRNEHLMVDPDNGALKLLKKLTLSDVPEAGLIFQDNGLILPKKN